MENCGKEITDGQAREAVKDTGIGTPATRAAIITTLLKRDYIERSGILTFRNRWFFIKNRIVIGTSAI